MNLSDRLRVYSYFSVKKARRQLKQIAQVMIRLIARVQLKFLEQEKEPLTFGVNLLALAKAETPSLADDS